MELVSYVLKLFYLKNVVEIEILYHIRNKIVFGHF